MTGNPKIADQTEPADEASKRIDRLKAKKGSAPQR
jgi:hypothetical protein